MEGVTTDSIVHVLIIRKFIFEKAHFLAKKYNAILLLDYYYYSYLFLILCETTPIFILRVSTE